MTDAEHPRGIHHVARAEPDRLAVIFDTPEGTRTLTFGQLEQRVNQAAHALSSVGVGPGDRVAVMLRNRPEVLVVWNGAARVGAQIVPISYRAAAPEARYIVDDSEAKVFVHEGAEAALEQAAEAPGLAAAWSADDPVWTRQPVEPPRAEYVAASVSWMNYTSGTTGKPKGIERPAPQPATETPPNPYMQFWGFGRDDVHLLTGPAYHTAPGAYAQMHLVEGATVVVMPRWDAEECLRLVDAHRVTNSHMVPANFVRILELPEQTRGRYDLSSIRKIIHGAAFCPPAVKRQIMEVFPPGTVWEYYGASEGMGTIISPEEWLEKPGSVGKPFPGLDARIFDDAGNELEPGEIGTVYLLPAGGYGPRYHNAPGKTEEVYHRGYYTVGDIGWVDEDGYLFLADRRTDLIIRGGVNIYPAEIEAALAEHDEVVDSAVFGLPDERLGHRVHAVVELTEGAAATEDELRRFVASRVADFKVPAAIEVIGELPREPNGKIRKRLLREERLETQATAG